MQRSIKFITIGIVSAGALALVSTGCGKKSTTGGGLSFSNLSQLPNESSIVAANAKTQSLDLQDFGRFAAPTVTGTAPTVVAALASDTTVNQDFFNGYVTKVAGDGASVPIADADAFFGQTIGGPAGQNACMMAQQTAQIIGQVVQGASTMCYMQGIPNAATGVTVTSGGVAQSQLFNQGAADRHVKITIKGMNDPHAPSSVNVIISGSNTTGRSSLYKAHLYMCDANGNVTQAEDMVVDTVAETFTDNQSNYQAGQYSEVNSLSASLTTDASGNIIFDTSKARTALFNQSFSQNGSSGSNKGQINIDSNGILHVLMGMNFSMSGSAQTNYLAASIQYTGNDINSVALDSAAVKMYNSGTWNNQTFTNTFSAAPYWSSTFYAAADPNDTANPRVADVSSENFSTDTFFTNLAPTTPTFSDKCGTDGDVDITMDFTDPNVAKIQSACDGHGMSDNLWQACNSQAIQSAQQTAQQAYWNVNH